MDSILSALLGGIFGAVIGGFFVVWATNKQVKVLIAQTSGSVHERLYNQNLEVMRFIAEHPKLYPYFFKNKELSKSKSEDEKAQILSTADLIVGFLDLAAVQIDELPEEFRPSWRKYIIEQYNSSPVLRQHIDDHPDWYVNGVLKLISESKKTDSVSKL